MRARASTLAALSLLAALAVVAGCGVKRDPVQCGEEFLASTGTITIDEVMPVLEAHCWRCHSTGQTGRERHGAPADANFDLRSVVTEQADEISFRGGTGEMPPDAQLSTRDLCLLLAWRNADLLE